MKNVLSNSQKFVAIIFFCFIFVSKSFATTSNNMYLNTETIIANYENTEEINAFKSPFKIIFRWKGNEIVYLCIGRDCPEPKPEEESGDETGGIISGTGTVKNGVLIFTASQNSANALQLNRLKGKTLRVSRDIRVANNREGITTIKRGTFKVSAKGKSVAIPLPVAKAQTRPVGRPAATPGKKAIKKSSAAKSPVRFRRN